ncbi:hypothetical protein ACFWU5_22030 [Nocardia sp. NPDC058640]|uniref:hypothetical protein n=1 Tax=Nocardia sp. NPDC058640 TaxID=3346571 RepID=UPI003653CA9C
MSDHQYSGWDHMYLDLLTTAALVDPHVFIDTVASSDAVNATTDLLAKKKKSNKGMLIGGICCLVVVVLIVGGIYLMKNKKKGNGQP